MKKVEYLVSKAQWDYDGDDNDWVLNVLFATADAIKAAGYKLKTDVEGRQFDWIYLPGYAEALSDAPEGFLPVAAWGGAYTDIMDEDIYTRGYGVSTASGQTYLVDVDGWDVDDAELPDAWRKVLQDPDVPVYENSVSDKD